MTLPHRIVLALAGVALEIIFSSPAWAQTSATTADLVVIATDDSGAVVPGAAISISNDERGRTRAGTTGSEGRLSVPVLPPGTYSVRVELAGFEPATVTVALSLGTETELTLILRLAAIAASVDVPAATPLVGMRRTAVATVVGDDQITRLPIDRRNYIAFALLTPGVAADRLLQLGPAESSGLVFAGQSPRANNITVDGLDNNDDSVGGARSTFSQDSVGEFQVLVSSYSAEFGKASGGVVNIVTKSGSNRVSGGLFEYFRDETLATRGHFDDFDAAGRSITAPKPPFSQHQFGGTLGGPLRRNRAFGFFAVERLAIRQNNTVTIDDATVIVHPFLGTPLGTPADILRRAGFAVEVGSVPFAVRTTTVLGKIDHAIGTSHSASIRFNSDVGEHRSIQPFGGLVARSRGGERDLRNYTVGGSFTSVRSSRTVNELRAQVAYRDQALRPLDGGPAVDVIGVASVGRVPLLPQERRAVRYQALDTVGHEIGAHQLKAGVDFNSIDVRTATLPLAFGGQFTFADIPPPLAALFGLPGPISSIQALALGFPVAHLKGYGDPASPHAVQDVSLFAQDEWRAGPRLTLRLGLRYQKQFMPDGPYRARGIASPFELTSSSTQLAPRLGLAWDPVGDGRTAVTAGYGRFFDDAFLVPMFFPRVVNGAQARVVLVTGGAAGAAWRAPGRELPRSALDALPSITISIGPKVDTPHTHHTSAGITRQLGDRTTLSVSGVVVKGGQYLGVIDYNPTLPDLGAGRRPMDVNGIAGTSGSVNHYGSWGESWYRGLLVSMNKRLAGRTQATLAYTLSKAEDTVNDFALNPAENQGRGRNPADPTGLPIDFDPRAERAPALHDQRHRLAISGVHVLPARFEVAGIFSVGSGWPYNILAGADLNGDGDAAVSPGPDRARTVPSDPSTSIGRNAARFPVESRVDLRMSRRMRVGGRAEIAVTLDALNAFNRTNYTDVNRVFGRGAYPSAPLPAYGQFTQAAPPRQLQLGARLAF